MQSMNGLPGIVGTTGAGVAFSLEDLTATGDATPRSDGSMQRLQHRTSAELDFEQLRDAALQKLKAPTRHQAVLSTVGEDSKLYAELVDLRDASVKAKLLDRIYEQENDDAISLAERIRKRLDAVGIAPKQVVVQWRDLSVQATIRTGKRALPSLPNAAIEFCKGMLRPVGIGPPLQKRTILCGVSGCLKPGRLTLLLGLPGAGKTTLLKCLANQAVKDHRLKVSGQVLYNGHTSKDFVVERVAAYVDQEDDHIGELTVRETLNFSAACRTSLSIEALVEELARREASMGIIPDPDVVAIMKAVALQGKDNVKTMMLLKYMGLEGCANTIIGGMMARGISGGEKRRVTTAEMLAGTVRVVLADEISTGLDSSTTYQLCKMLRELMQLNNTFLIALLQPGPETVGLFDDIMLMSEGYIVYHGPTAEVLSYFSSIALQCPAGLPTQEFLQAVTDKGNQEEFWSSKAKYAYLDGRALSQAFEITALGRAAHIEAFEDVHGDEDALETQSYAITPSEMLGVCMNREIKLFKRGITFVVFRAVQVIIVGVVVGTLFLNLPTNTVMDGSAAMGVLFFSTMNTLFGGAPEISLTIQRLPVLYKHREYKFFPPWAFVIPNFLLKVPQGMLDVLLWTNIVYWLVGLAPEVGRYFTYMLVLFVMHQVGMTLFRALSSLCRDMVISQFVMSFYFLAVQLASGFVNSADAIPVYWIWAYWISPTAYAIRSLAINELTSAQWSTLIPGTNTTVGVASLESRGFKTEQAWIWWGVFALTAMVLGCVLLQVLCLTFLQPLRGIQMVLEDLPGVADGSGKKKKGTKLAAVSADIPLSSNAAVRSSYSGVAVHDLDSPATSSEALDNVMSSAKAPLTGGHTDSCMKIEFLPITLTFQDLRYSVPMPVRDRKARGLSKNTQLELLKGITGSFRPSVLTALMGSSGAGKSTLMDVLAGRKTGGIITGEIKVNGFTKHQGSFNRFMGYCEQVDLHTSQLTVYETLVYSARLRLPSTTDTAMCLAYVESMMSVVDLHQLSGALVGQPGMSGLSLEQRKRLSICCELVSNPSVLFLDEPTSGLEAKAASIVANCIRATADTGRTVVATIHQPSPDIFFLFDDLVLLQRGGRTIYTGPLAPKCSKIIEYFEAIKGVPAFADESLGQRNPADWMLDVTNPAAAERLGVDFADIWEASKESAQIEGEVAHWSQPAGADSVALELLPSHKLTLMAQCKVLTTKIGIIYWRTPEFNLFRMVMTVVIGLVFGSMFFMAGETMTQMSDVLNNMGNMFSSALFLGSSNMGAIIPVMFAERPIFYRDKAAGVYSALPYVIAQTIVELPYSFVQTMLYVNIVFWMVGYQISAGHYIWFVVINFVNLLLWGFLGIMNSALFPNQALAAIVGQATLMPLWNLTAGFTIPPPMIPPWYWWLMYSNPVHYTLYALMTTQFASPSMAQFVVMSPITNEQQTLPDYLATYFGFRYDMRWFAFGMMVVFVLVFRAVAFLAFAKVNHQKR